MGFVSHRRDNTPGTSTSTTKGPEQILVTVGVGNDVVTICSDDRYLQDVVYAYEPWCECDSIGSGEFFCIPRP